MEPIDDIELRLLLDAIYHRFHYDFRQYSPASVRRRVTQGMLALGCKSLSALQDRVLHDPETFPQLLQYLTVQVSDLFRDPGYFRVLREGIVPILQTYPSLKIWIAGCSTGEEVYSFAILLRECGLLDKTPTSTRRRCGARRPPDLLPDLFDPFHRARHAPPREAQGLGLGLFIAEQIVTAHGGSIAVVSTETEGTRFTVRLPVQDARTPAA